VGVHGEAPSSLLILSFLYHDQCDSGDTNRGNPSATHVVLLQCSGLETLGQLLLPAATSSPH
jgi:hypothetical protein